MYVASQNIITQVHASTGSNFTLHGNDIINIYTGSGIGNYFISQALTLSGADGIKEIQSTYIK